MFKVSKKRKSKDTDTRPVNGASIINFKHTALYSTVNIAAFK